MNDKSSVGRPAAYAAARVIPRKGGRHTADEVYADYEAWCAKARLVPLREGVFAQRFAALAQSVDIPVHVDWGDRVYLDVAFGTIGKA